MRGYACHSWSFLVWLTVVGVVADESGDYCNCQYTVPAALEPNCRVYGQLGDAQLIPWYRANQSCLDEWDIKVSSLDSDALWKMCPYANVTNSSIQLLVNELKFNPSPATKAIQAYYDQFWVESTTVPGSYVFLDTISDSRNNVIDCTLSESSCWNTIKEYFTNNPSAVGQACQEFHARQRFNLELEQSTVRIRLCNEKGSSTSGLCEPLQAQVAQYQSANPTKQCSAFGLGPANNGTGLPVCDAGSTNGSGARGGSGTKSNSRAVCVSMSLLLAMVFGPFF
jgi:hypothetical protein